MPLDETVYENPDLLLAELGLDSHAIRQVLDEPATFDVRDEPQR